MQKPIEQLIEIMKTLRGEQGCAWDRKQDLSSLKKYLLEESYEVLEAINNLENSPTEEQIKEHKEELGDLLLQIIFQSEIQSEKGHFSFDDVAKAIVEKLIRRHPHIFGKEENDKMLEDNPFWHVVKQEEKKGKNSQFLDDIPQTFPALVCAQKMGEKAGHLGFDWEQADHAFDKVSEEIEELIEAVADKNTENIEEEIGDLLYVITQFARWYNIDAELALHRANNKFKSRFHAILAMAGGQEQFKQLTPQEMTMLWDMNKK